MPLVGEVEVEHGGFELGVPQVALDEAGIHAGFKQMRGVGMTLMPSSALASQFCHASVRGRLRYSYGAGTPGAQRRQHHHGLYPRGATRRARGAEAARSTIRHSR